MQDIQQALISFFEQVALKNNAQLDKLKQQQCFSIDINSWQFTLPDLYSYLQQQVIATSNIEYKEFRQLIFNSPINQTVKSHGAEIIIKENLNKVDKSTYALIWSSLE